jgi:hypothetical protein
MYDDSFLNHCAEPQGTPLLPVAWYRRSEEQVMDFERTERGVVESVWRGQQQMHMNENDVTAVAMSEECLLDREGKSRNGGKGDCNIVR